MVARTSYVVASKLTKFRVVQNLVAGANVITDNLALATPFARLVELFDNATGGTFSARITNETANTFTITTAIAAANIRITVL